MTLSVTHDRSRVAPRAPARRLSRGLGLLLGAAVSLGLWAGLIFVGIRLLG